MRKRNYKKDISVESKYKRIVNMSFYKFVNKMINPLSAKCKFLSTDISGIAQSVGAKMNRHLFGKVREDLFENIPSD